MLKPAAMYREQIIQKFKERYYTDDMMYSSGCNSNWFPEISDCPDEDNYQFAVVNSKEECIGYIGFRIDWYTSCAYSFGMMSFDKGNAVFGKDVYELMNTLIHLWHLHRIEWRMIEGNPAEKAYDRFCNEWNGTKYIMHDVIKDRQGVYHNNIIYEILI